MMSIAQGWGFVDSGRAITMHSAGEAGFAYRETGLSHINDGIQSSSCRLRQWFDILVRITHLVRVSDQHPVTFTSWF
jgi:hypothetical protein